MRRFCLFLASGLGLGIVAPFAPGTLGSLPGVALAFATTLLPLHLQIMACAALVLLAVPVCGVAERALGIKDDGRIAADEVEDFVSIQNELERISVTVETLQLWAEKKIASGEIDMEAYRAAIGRK